MLPSYVRYVLEIKYGLGDPPDLYFKFRLLSLQVHLRERNPFPLQKFH